MKRGKKGSRSNETNFFSFFFCSLFSTIVLSNLRAIRFFFYGREGLFVESAGQGCEGGDSESREMLFDRQLQRIVTEGTFRHGRNCADYKENHSPQALARFCCESKHAFLLFYQLRTTGPYV